MGGPDDRQQALFRPDEEPTEKPKGRVPDFSGNGSVHWGVVEEAGGKRCYDRGHGGGEADLLLVVFLYEGGGQ